MKKTKRFLAVVLCMLLMLTPLAVVAETVTVQAAGPQTVKVKLDKKTGKRYGYDENNQKVTQQWGVTAKGFRYYFGKNGAAYQADQDMVGKYGILMKKINGKYYGFDVSGHTVKGIRVGSVSMYEVPKLYYFNPKTGAVDKKKTSLYRKYAATSTLAKQNNASKIKKVLGKYKKCTISKGNTCMLDGNGENQEEIEAVCSGADISIEYKNGEQIVILNGENVNAMIRTEQVGNMASKSSANPKVRAHLLKLQRTLAEKNDVVMDGRDIGTTILPNAEVKIYLTASADTRAKRRALEYEQKGEAFDLEQIRKDIIERDERDMNREISPLKQAEDAVLVDSSEMGIDDVVNAILNVYKEKVQK